MKLNEFSVELADNEVFSTQGTQFNKRREKCNAIRPSITKFRRRISVRQQSFQRCAVRLGSLDRRLGFIPSPQKTASWLHNTEAHIYRAILV